MSDCTICIHSHICIYKDYGNAYCKPYCNCPYIMITHNSGGKHGKWEKADTIMGTYNRCSVCHFDEFNIDFPYCPNCGAKMDLESEKE